jgi:hypothetical protein
MDATEDGLGGRLLTSARRWIGPEFEADEILYVIET